MDNQAPAEMATADVNSGAPIQDPALSSSDNNEIVQGENQEQAATPENNEVLPFGKHPRWQQMLQKNKEYAAKLQDYESKLKEFEAPAQLHKALQSNPQLAPIVGALLRGATPEQVLQALQDQNKDPYEGYSEDAREHLKTLTELKEWKAKQEQVAVQNAQYTADTTFNDLLIKDGYCTIEDGETGQALVATDQELVDVISSGVKSLLNAHAENPDAPSPAEVKAAYESVQQSIKKIQEAAQKTALKNVVKPEVPPSGSRRGAAPISKKLSTSKDRVAAIVESLGGAA